MTIAETIAPDESLLFGDVSSLARSKRVFDVLIGVPLCVLAVPIVAVFALVLLVQLRANPFFVHDRIGRHGRLVSIPKLRTLPPSTPMYADKLSERLVPVSSFAAFLRRTHLDEIPQLFLVPFGRMTLVGPRPRMVEEAQACPDDAFARDRTQVTQGCTGLWQVSHAQHRRVSDDPEFDRFYLEHRSARLDAWILWRTLLLVLAGSTVGLPDVPRWALRRTR